MSPARSECAPNDAGFLPIVAAHFFTTRQMTLSESRVGSGLFHRFTPRKSGPDVSIAASTHASTALTGQVRGSSRSCSIRPSTKRARNSLSTVWSKPGSVSSKARAYFQSMWPRTASAAWRSESPSTYCRTETRASRAGEVAGWPWSGNSAELIVVIEGAENLGDAQAEGAFGEGGLGHASGFFRDHEVGIRMERHGASRAEEWSRAGYGSVCSKLSHKCKRGREMEFATSVNSRVTRGHFGS